MQQARQLQAPACRSEGQHQFLQGGGPRGGSGGGGQSSARIRQTQPAAEGSRPGREQHHALAEAADGLLQLGAAGLVQLLDLGDIEGLLEGAATGGNQHQVVIDQGRGDRLGLLADQGAAAADQAHAPVAADLQVGASQAAGLPKALQEASGPLGIATAQGQHPAGRMVWRRGRQQGQADFFAQPGG